MVGKDPRHTDDRRPSQPPTMELAHPPRMRTPTPPLRLSVVFVARRSLAAIQRTLETLLAQTAAPRIECIVSADSPELLREAEDFLAPSARFAQSRFLLHQTQDLSRARALSVAEASGDVVAFTEDHCFPEPNWAEELLAAFESSDDVLAAAPAMRNPNPATAVSRVQFLLFFGRHRHDSSARNRFDTAPRLPTHNTAYRRDALTEALRERTLAVEALLQEQLRVTRPDARFLRCTHTCVGHVNMSRLLPSVTQAYVGGRLFGSARADHAGWGLAMRVLRCVTFPLVPLIVIRRSAPLLRDTATPATFVANVCTAWTLELIHAAGEAIGICLGAGRAAERYADSEVDRSRFVRPDERGLLSGRRALR